MDEPKKTNPPAKKMIVSPVKFAPLISDLPVSTVSGY